MSQIYHWKPCNVLRTSCSLYHSLICYLSVMETLLTPNSEIWRAKEEKKLMSQYMEKKKHEERNNGRKLNETVTRMRGEKTKRSK